MTDYKGIHGGKVQNFSTNPPAPILGQVWYNETTRTLNYLAGAAGAWASGNNMNTARNQLLGTGIQTSALAFGGDSSSVKANTESYNGSSWTEVNDLNTARWGAASAGNSNTAALAISGYTPPTGSQTANVESWNGTSWTEVNNVNTARQEFKGSGSSTAALAYTGGPPMTGATESWNGTKTLLHLS